MRISLAPPFCGAKLTNAVLAKADGACALVDGADLSGVDFSGAKLEKASFLRAKLDDAIWDVAVFDRAVFDPGAGPGA